MTVCRVEVTATDGAARTGRVHTARGSYPVPAFMPVGTKGAVKALDSADLDALDVGVVLANTYHLMLRPGRRRGGRTRGAAPVHRVGRAHPHRLGRFPGPLAVAEGRRRRRGLRLRLRRHRRPPDPRVGRGGPGAARRRHPDGPRRLRHAPGPPGGPPPGRRADGGVGGPGPDPPRPPGGQAGAPGALRHRPGRLGPGAPRRERPADGRDRVRRLRHRRPVGGGGPAGDAGGPGRHRAPPARRPAPLPDGGGGPGGDGRGHRPGGRPVRLRGTHADGPPRDHPHRRGAGSTSGTPPTPGTTPRSTRPAGVPPAGAGRGGTCGTCWRWGSRRRGACSASTTWPSSST